MIVLLTSRVSPLNCLNICSTVKCSGLWVLSYINKKNKIILFKLNCEWSGQNYKADDGLTCL